METKHLARGELLRMALIRLALGFLVLMTILFASAGTFAYWQAWVYLAVLFVPITFVLFYLLKNDPELLERRMRIREKESAQKRVIGLSLIYYLAIFVFPGLDVRFGWSNVPVPVVLLGDALVLLGYGIILMVFRENSYASRVVEVEKGQHVISTGVYAIVRHPMYLGVTIMYIFSPLALGSYWAMLPALLIIPILVSRIWNEESVLAQELPGYQEYMRQTKYHLVPGIW